MGLSSYVGGPGRVPGIDCPIQGFVGRLVSTDPNYRVHSVSLQLLSVTHTHIKVSSKGQW